MTKQNLPLQPLYLDQNGTIRFQENAVVNYLLNNGGLNMNDIAMQGFPKEHLEQFAQLIGYSLYGFADLSYVKESTVITAENIFHNKDVDPLQAKCDALEAELNHCHQKLEKIVSKLEEIIDGD